MHLYIYNLKETLYEGETESVSLPTTDGEISVLLHHVPLVTSLTKGDVRLRNGGKEKSIPLSGGFAYTDGENLVVLAN